MKPILPEDRIEKLDLKTRVIHTLHINDIFLIKDLLDIKPFSKVGRIVGIGEGTYLELVGKLVELGFQVDLTSVDDTKGLPDRCEECGFYKYKDTGTCPKCGDVMKMKIDGMCMTWGCTKCDFTVMTTAQRYCYNKVENSIINYSKKDICPFVIK